MKVLVIILLDKSRKHYDKKSTQHYYVEDSSSVNTKTEKRKELPLTNSPRTSIQLHCVTQYSLPQTGCLVYFCIFTDSLQFQPNSTFP